MPYYRQIAVLTLFFLILFIFIYPNQDSFIYPILKGVAIGGLVVIFISFAFPQVFKIGEIQTKDIEDSEIDLKEPSFSMTVKTQYKRLLLQILDLVGNVNAKFSAAIYMIDSENKGYTCQEKSYPDFSDFIETENEILAETVKKRKPSLFKKSNKNTGWDELLGSRTWRGSETLIGFPVLYDENIVGVLIVYMDHFSSILDRDQQIIERLSQFITHGMEDLEHMEALMIDNQFNFRLANLFDQFEVKSDESELFESIRSICRSFFQYDKLTIVLSSEDKEEAVIKLVDGLLDDADEGMEFKIQNSLHGKAIQDNTIFCSNSWFDEYPNMGRFKSGDMNEYNFMSVLSIPLRSDGESRGAITLELLRSKVYSDTDIRLLKLLCSKISTILNWQKAYKKVHLTSIHDGLTGLLNHKAFLNRFEEEISRAERFNQMFGLVILDLDKFKSVNDSYGHLYGDYVLEDVAKIISESVRTIDVVGRYGGEEFAVLLINSDIEDCIPVAERIVKSIEAKTFLKSSIATNITISGGLAGFPRHAKQVKDLIEKADKAMYESKSIGGNRVTITTDA